MKRLIRIGMIILLIQCFTAVNGQPPPPPAGGHGAGGNQPAGGGGSIGGGMLLLLSLGAAYGGKKYLNYRSKSEQ